MAKLLSWKIGDVTVTRLQELEIPIPYSTEHAFLREATPEVLKTIRVTHGPYDPHQGDFAVAGSVNMDLGLEDTGFIAKGTYGSFDARRVFLGFAPADRHWRESGRSRTLRRSSQSKSGPGAGGWGKGVDGNAPHYHVHGRHHRPSQGGGFDPGVQLLECSQPRPRHGLSPGGSLSPLQQAFLDEQAGQCGYCLSGILISAAALLARNPRPSRSEIAAALDRHLCRCGAHNRIMRAVARAGRQMGAAP